jgi:peptide chain release factor 1
LEVRPGEGGDDAIYFATQLYDAMLSYAKRKGAEVLDSGGTYRTMTVKLYAPQNLIENFCGVHRIQRIPVNDTRRHTSTATVAVLVPQKIQCQINTSDLMVEVYKGSGPGGQHKNKTETGVKILHIPSGIRVKCEDERSQLANHQKAMKELERRLQRYVTQGAKIKEDKNRNEQISSGERSVKEFTWNSQRNEVIDHSTGKRWNFKRAMKGKF